MKEYDFYFSKRASDWYKELYEDAHNYDEIAIYGHVCYFQGKEYTEMVSKGNKPVSNFSDMVLIGTGFEKDCTYIDR